MNSDEVRDHWAQRSGAYSPAYYAHHGPDETSETVRATLERYLDRDAAVLELGCSSGRHLAHLHEHGFEDLSGIELNGEAFDVMADAYPDLADAGTFYHAAIEDVVETFPDGRFDAVYSVETLQHLHPDAEWVLEELVRITDDVLLTVENEGGPNDRDDRDDAERPVAGGDAADREHDHDSGVDARADGVNYVDDDFPLYYRDWHDVITGLGLRAVDATTGKRDTIRTFRVPENRTGE